MELDVVIRCRKSDTELVQSVLAEAGKEYTDKLRAEVPKLKDREMKCKLRVDDKNYLPELNITDPGLPSW